MGLTLQQATIHAAPRRVVWELPGVRGRIEPDKESTKVTQEIRISVHRQVGTPGQV
jgi:hypothetical protein